VLPVDPPPGAGLRPEDLVALAADAAARAFQLATGSGDGGLSLDLEADLARRAAGLLGTGRGLAELAASAGMPSRELLRWGVIWQQAGRGGLEALRTTWQPAATDLVEGRAALDRLAGQDAVRAWRNRLNCGGLQLRLGGDGQWYRFVAPAATGSWTAPRRRSQVRSWTTTRPAEPGWPRCRGIAGPAGLLDCAE
jgi:hypothetical protein